MKLLLITLLTLLPLLASAEEVKLRTITVSGQAQEEFAPDIARFSVNVSGRDGNRTKSKELHDKMLKTLLDIAKKHKVADKDLSTGYSGVSREYDYTSGKPKLKGYLTQTNIQLTMRDFNEIGPFQEELVTAGFEDFQGPNYALDKIFTYQDKVMASAVLNAKEKASQIASKLGENIGKVLEVHEQGTTPPAPIENLRMAKVSSYTGVADASISQPAGVIQINSSITATFQLK